MTFTLTAPEYFATVEKIAKVNERAAKKGFTGRLEVVGEKRTVTEKDALGFERSYVVFDTEVTGEAPSYGGWSFVARVDAVGDSFTLATAPGVEHVDRSSVRPGHCDHCKANRARKNTMLVRNDETGEIVNVGSTCIKDFLGWDASVVFLSEDDVEREIDGIRGSFEREYDVPTILAYAYAATRAFGWVPSSAFDSRPTADWVRLGLGMYRPTKQDEKELPRLREFAAEANEQAATIRAFILSDEFSGTSTYVDNLKVAASLQAVTARQVGLLASAPNAYTRHLESEADRKAREARWAAEKDAKKVSEFIGQVGDKKVRVEGTIEGIRYIEGDYGTTVLYTILTAEGNVVKWFASREALGEKEGREVVIEGTIKKHDEYQGVKSTVLTRCKEIA